MSTNPEMTFNDGHVRAGERGINIAPKDRGFPRNVALSLNIDIDEDFIISPIGVDQWRIGFECIRHGDQGPSWSDRYLYRLKGLLQC